MRSSGSSYPSLSHQVSNVALVSLAHAINCSFEADIVGRVIERRIVTVNFVGVYKAPHDGSGVTGLSSYIGRSRVGRLEQQTFLGQLRNHPATLKQR